MADAPSRARASRLLRVLRPVAIVLVVALLAWGAVLFVRGDLDLADLRHEVGRFGPAAPIAFTLLIAMTVPLLLPSTPFVLASGLLFGLWIGTLVAVMGQSLGALTSYALGHFLGVRSVEDRVGPRVRRFLIWSRKRGTWGIAAMQATPLLPRKILNYALPAAGYRPRQVAIGTFIGMTPLTLLVVATGDALFTVAAVRDLVTLRVLGPLAGIVVLVAAWLGLARHVVRTVRARGA